MSDERVSGSDRNTLLSFVGILVQHHKLFVAGILIGLLIAAGGVLLKTPTFTSRASFMPQAPRKSDISQLAGLAGQFGVNIGVGQAVQAPFFYVDLLRSREILGAAVDSTYTESAEAGGRRADLTSLFEGRGTTQAKRREDAIRKLRKATSTTVLPRSGLVVLSVRSRDASLSQQVANNLLRELDQFNMESRQSQASAERRFIEGRLGSLKAELMESEERLRLFLEENRDYRSSPRLMFEADRLQRDVTMRQQLVTSVAQSHEQARIDEVRDTPIIMIVEPPDLAVDADSRHLLNKSFVGVLLGGLIGFGFAAVLEFVRANRLGEILRSAAQPRRRVDEG